MRQQRYQEPYQVGHVEQPPQNVNSVLSFALNNVANRAAQTQINREYKKFQPNRYRVKSKVTKNVKV